jgi:hypothetical protein
MLVLLSRKRVIGPPHGLTLLKWARNSSSTRRPFLFNEASSAVFPALVCKKSKESPINLLRGGIVTSFFTRRVAYIKRKYTE